MPFGVPAREWKGCVVEPQCRLGLGMELALELGKAVGSRSQQTEFGKVGPVVPERFLCDNQV